MELKSHLASSRAVRRAGAVLALALSVAALPALPALPADAQEPQMSEQDKAMMEAMMKAGTPGKEHEWLAKKAGSWTFTGKFWMNPAAPPMETTGTVERSMILNGRVLAETVKTSMMGEPFEGHGMTGYDNVKHQYWGTWNDSMSTALMVSWGTCDESGACSFTATVTDPMSGETRQTRMTSRDEGSDKELMEAFDKGPDGKEFKTMELVYSRKK
jgi:hypothetical protein